MKWFTKALLLGIALAVPATSALADGHHSKAIKARKAHMQLLSFNLGNLGAMAKGKVAYDAGKAKTFATNLDLAAQMKNGAMWPKGTDNVSMKGKTRALPASWDTWPDIGKKFDDFSDAAGILSSTAGDGLAALQAGVKGVGKTCGGCHKKFRASKKKKS
ncbi:MAG: cytochrome c [Chromatiales bacterium]|jgi:cytochrome c556|nr:cytochrome c [Chromatiales bacterium]